MHKQNTDSDGFTIVELLIVIVVIAILAAISIVAYTGIQDRVISSTVKSDLSNFAKKMEITKVDSSDGLYPEANALTQAMGFKVTKSVYYLNRSNWVYCPSSDRTNYAIGVLDNKNRGYFLTASGGTQENVEYGGSQTCAMVGVTSGPGNHRIGYMWDSGTNTGTWNDWVN